MTAFRLTEARARFCYHPGVRHTAVSERRAAEAIQAAVAAEGHVARLPVNREEGEGRRGQSAVQPHVVMPMLNAGMTVERVAAELGVSPETVRDRKRLWPMNKRVRR